MTTPDEGTSELLAAPFTAPSFSVAAWIKEQRSRGADLAVLRRDLGRRHRALNEELSSLLQVHGTLHSQPVARRPRDGILPTEYTRSRGGPPCLLARWDVAASIAYAVRLRWYASMPALPSPQAELPRLVQLTKELGTSEDSLRGLCGDITGYHDVTRATTASVATRLTAFSGKLDERAALEVRPVRGEREARERL